MRAGAAAACVALLISACAGDEAPALGLRATPSGSAVEVEAYISAFELADKLGQPAREGEGHVHFYLDVEDLPTAAGRPAITDDESTYHASAESTHTWQDLEPGDHVFGAQLVNNDHTPLDPPVTATVKVTIEG